MVDRCSAIRRALSWAVAGALGSATAVLGQDPGKYLSYEWKGLVMQPQFDASAMFTDNLFYARGPLRVSDYVLTFSPGARLQYGRDGENQVAIEYMHDEVRILDRSEFSSRQDRLDLSVTYTQGKFKLTGRDNISLLSGLLGGAANQQQLLVDRRVHADSWALTFDWTEKTDLSLRLNHSWTDYDRRAALVDQQTFEGQFGASYQATPKLRFTVDPFFGHSTTEANRVPQAIPSSVFYGAFVGVRGELTAKLNGSVRLGYERRDFTSGDDISAQTPAVAADLTYRMTVLRTISLRYDRRTFPSPQFANQISVSDAVTLRADQFLGGSGRWMVRGTARYLHNDLTATRAFAGLGTINLERTDDLLAFGLAVFYQPQPWIRASAAYDFEDFSIAFKDALAAAQVFAIPYHNHRVSLSLSLGF